MHRLLQVHEIVVLTDMRKADIERVLDAQARVICHALKNGERVNLTGVGTLKTTTHKPRKSRNPKTGVTFMLPERRAVKFKASESLSASLQGHG